MKAVAAIFDFDGTLTKEDSFLRFLWYCSTLWTCTRKSPFIGHLLLGYALGVIDNNRAKEKLFQIFFAHTNKREFAAKAQLFSHSILPSLIRAEPMQRFQWHKEQGHQCILASASIEDYLMPWAERVGFSKVLATQLEVDVPGFLTGRFLGKNCYGPEKARRVEEYLGALHHFEIYAYGDSRGDKELLDIADHPFYRSVGEERAFPHKQTKNDQ